MSTKTALKILFSCILLSLLVFQGIASAGADPWFIAIMLLGNMAMSAYVLRELFRLRPDQAAREILTARNR
jgi:hypothetical protein